MSSRTVNALPLRPSDWRRAEHLDDSCESDVPTPEEIDPSLLDRFDCDHDDLVDPEAPLATDDQPYCDAP